MRQLVLGIDEAGRGPVIGPMVICGIVVEEKDISELKRMGVKDSKLLSSARREKLMPLIEKKAKKWELIKLTPSQIDKYGITFLQLKGIARLIDSLSPDVAIIDSPTYWSSSYERKIRALIGNKTVKLVVENFADKKYSVVSAASIIAKVERDREIKALSSVYGEIGSGYPSDRKTVRFLEKCLQEEGCFPDIVRKRWKTVKKLILKINKDKMSE